MVKVKDSHQKRAWLKLGLCTFEGGTCHFGDTIESEHACRCPTFLNACPFHIPYDKIEWVKKR